MAELQADRIFSVRSTEDYRITERNVILEHKGAWITAINLAAIVEAQLQDEQLLLKYRSSDGAFTTMLIIGDIEHVDRLHQVISLRAAAEQLVAFALTSIDEDYNDKLDQFREQVGRYRQAWVS